MALNLVNTLRMAAVGTAVLAIAGCNAHQKMYTQAVPLTNVEDRHPILEPGDFVTYDMPVVEGEGRMSRKERTDLEVFFHGYRENGGGPLFIATPQGTENETAAVLRLAEIRDIALRTGVPEDVMVIEPYVPYEGAFAFPVSLKYQTSRLVLPQCGHIGEDLGRNWNNEPYGNFGCSRQRNIALMASNPADLRGPRPVDPRYGPERARALGKYTKGEKTQSANNQDTGDALSDVGE